jgi:hypothetical protein
MLNSKLLGTFGLCAVLNLASPQAEAFPDKATIKSEIVSNCTRSPSSCISIITEEIALNAQLSNSPEGLAVALGLAAAVVEINKTNPALALKLMALIAKKGPASLQAAVAAAVSAASASTSSGGGGSAGSAS